MIGIEHNGIAVAPVRDLMPGDCVRLLGEEPCSIEQIEELEFGRRIVHIRQSDGQTARVWLWKYSQLELLHAVERPSAPAAAVEGDIYEEPSRPAGPQSGAPTGQ